MHGCGEKGKSAYQQGLCKQSLSDPAEVKTGPAPPAPRGNLV